jgi:site-specific DNA-methyltransferase (adenine-specific)
MIVNGDSYEYIKSVESGSVDLVLTDPPYSISKESNFKKISETTKEEMISKYSKLSIDFGYWDRDIDLYNIMSQFYRVLRRGGTLIIFFDIWKAGQLLEISKELKFKQPRIGIWEKTNPVPVNSKINYLSNSREYFFSFVKGGKPTFNSKYDRGVYHHPICHEKGRFHPTQKPISLINDLVLKHSREGDFILDTFSGSGVVAESCLINKRRFLCIEKDEDYYKKSLLRIKPYENIL